MSERFPGGFMTQSPPTPSASNATGIWTLDQQEQLKQAGQWPPNGPFFIEDLFSTWLYTGNGSTQTINNGIDLAGKGGLVWLKGRSAASNHSLYDTARGINRRLRSNDTSAENTSTQQLTSFNSNGFDLGVNEFNNSSGLTAVSWTFRDQPKFFDVVTWTGNNVVGRTIPHNLGSNPRCIIVKRTDTTSNWVVWHNDGESDSYLFLNTTAASTITNANNGYAFASSSPSGANQIILDTAETSLTAVNASGGTYVAYLFAHNAGGFGLSGTDNVISCGSFTSNSDGSASVTLGYEPQFLLYKRTDSTGDWTLLDTMRGFSQSDAALLRANLSSAEQVVSGDLWNPTATGFIGEPGTFGVSTQNIYIAIRRGPMKTPTTGTSVFSPNAVNAVSGTQVNTGFTVDMQMGRTGPRSGNEFQSIQDRLRGISTTTTASGERLFPNNNEAENSSTQSRGWNNTGFQIPPSLASMNAIFWNFSRAPGFFDEVCWTGTSADQTLTHNLGAVPELIIYKRRGSTGNWYTGCSFTGSNYSNLNLNLTNAASTLAYTDGGPFPAQPTATQFSVGQFYSTTTMVAYLFASCPGVSKVGTYTGTGTTQTINCGFTGGARFVLIKRTDSTGDWYVWDTARGMIPANDPYLLLNSTAAEVTGTDFVDTAATGFEITSTAPAAINASGGTFLYLAIA
jgi:hypothetical protein